MNALKTFDPPLHALDGSRLAGVARRGKHLLVESDAGLVLLIHLMSAGRLQLFDRRAGLRDRTSRILIRLDDGRELRLREFGTKQAAWAKLLRADELEDEEALATLGPEAWPDPPPFGAAARRAAAPAALAAARPARRSPGSAARGSTRSCGRRGCRRSSAART